jgi:putative transposase
MSIKFLDKYRIPTARASWWNYGDNAPYFVTICTKEKRHYFGKIEDRKITLTDIGLAAITCWNAIPDHFPFVKLDAFVVMPNHLHGIIVIDKPPIVKTQDFTSENVESQNLVASSFVLDSVETQDFASGNVEPKNIAALDEGKNNHFGPQSKNLASIVRGFIIGVTMAAKSLEVEFRWQTRYHDHIIRDEQSFVKIRNYIKTNVLRWKEDVNFS